MELGERIITELKLKLACEDERVDDSVCIIRNNFRTRKPFAGWNFFSGITHVFPIDWGETEGK